MEQLFSFIQTLHDHLNPLVYLGILLLASCAGGVIANLLKAPRVIGFLLTGMLFSPSILGIFHEELIKEELSIITHIALSVIAFSIGGSLELTKIKRLGKQILVITFTQAFGAFFLSLLALSLYFFFVYSMGLGSHVFWTAYFPLGLIIAAISAATAPAATLAMVHENKARGPFTSILLGVVALDDALTIFMFAFALTVAHSLVSQQAVSISEFILHPLFSILISLAIGGAMGFIAKVMIRYVSGPGAMLAVMLGSIFFASGVAFAIDAHPLLANMMMGFLVVNYVRHHENLFEVVETIEEPLFGMFFALAGAHLDLSVMKTAGLLGVIITLGRFSGKILGTRIGADISKAPATVKKYLGFALLPKAGVTVGLVLQAKSIFPESYGEMLINGVLASVLLNEIMTPFLLRFALIRSGEAMTKTPTGPKGDSITVGHKE